MKQVVKVLLVLIGLLSLNVYADEAFYTNDNGVSLTQQEYNFFTNMYWDGFQDYVDDTLYNKYASMGLYDKEIKTTIKEIEPSNYGSQAYGLIHETTAKKLQLSYGCSGVYCTMVTSLQWKGTPTVRSYDVMGSLLEGNLTRWSTPTTKLYWSGTTITYTDRVYSGDGYGCSVLLQNSSTNMRIVQDVDLEITGNGIFFSSYQHATSNITLETSKKYTVDFGGYGGVFFFYGSAVGIYDHMAGVDVELSLN